MANQTHDNGDHLSDLPGHGHTNDQFTTGGGRTASQNGELSVLPIPCRGEIDQGWQGLTATIPLTPCASDLDLFQDE